jgi:hypothetical protein
MFQFLWSWFNGKKFNTGAAITILATVLQQAFAKEGMSPDDSVAYATYLVQAVGVVIMLVGYIHKIFKPAKAT